jgi:predicted dehydrogenase
MAATPVPRDIFAGVKLEPKRGGLIGCGYFGQIQSEAWSRMNGVSIVAACDPDPARAAHCAANVYTDAAAMLEHERLDFVDIATRPDTHLPLVRLCLERGLPVIVQKPLAPSMEDALAIAQLAEETAVPVMVHENWRWQPWHRELKRRVAAGDIGAPFGYHFTMLSNDGLGPNPYPTQPYFATMPRLVMFESLIHPVDAARFHFGDVQRVYAVTRKRNPIIAGEDRAVLLLSHHSDVDGVVEGHRYLLPEPPGPAMGHSIIEGEQGRLVALANGDVFANGQLVWRNTTTEGYKGDSVKATQQHFLDCLESGTEFETSVSRYLGSFATVEAAYVSAREQQAVEV